MAVGPFHREPSPTALIDHAVNLVIPPDGDFATLSGSASFNSSHLDSVAARVALLTAACGAGVSPRPGSGARPLHGERTTAVRAGQSATSANRTICRKTTAAATQPGGSADFHNAPSRSRSEGILDLFQSGAYLASAGWVVFSTAGHRPCHFAISVASICSFRTTFCLLHGCCLMHCNVCRHSRRRIRSMPQMKRS